MQLLKTAFMHIALTTVPRYFSRVAFTAEVHRDIIITDVKQNANMCWPILLKRRFRRLGSFSLAFRIFKLRSGVAKCP